MSASNFKSENVIPALREFFSTRREVLFAYLFGSLATNQATPLSDIDIAVYIDPHKIKDEEYLSEFKLRLMGQLMNLLQTDHVDIVALNQTPPLLNHRIVSAGILVDQKDSSTEQTFFIRTLREYEDTRCLREIQFRHALKHFRTYAAWGIADVIDVEVIRKHLTQIDELLGKLEKYARISREKFLSDDDIRLASERAIHLAIQNMLDVGTHMLAVLHIRNVADYRSVFVELGHAGILPERFAEKIADLARIRNRIVHDYADVTPREVYDFLQNRISELATFGTFILDYIKRSTPD